MNISDLGKILDNDLKKYYDVVLINGIWGVGKTFYINRYLKDKKSIYVSLFGLKNMEELKSNLYFSLICNLFIILGQFRGLNPSLRTG